jgi:uncharacterized protein YecE (DUF72 family)
MEWLPKINQLDGESSLTLVYMNNHWQGQAVGTARQLKLLKEGEIERGSGSQARPHLRPSLLC